MPGLQDPLFQPVHISRASGEIVHQVEKSISDGRLAPGDRLPSEKELGAQFGLSRTVVREALRVLESQGLVFIKVGAGGGAFVAAPSTLPVSQALVNMIRLQGLTIGELVEARLAIETCIVTFASERATPEDVAIMSRAIAAAEAGHAAGESHFTPHSVDFHVALARAAQSRGLLFAVNALRTPFYETLDRLLPDEGMALRAIKDHRKLLDAIVAHDGARARRVMRGHILYFQNRTEKLGLPTKKG
jgi:GntR family transcriptional repressor for pyruvate dehydrogenase complex